MKRCWWILLAPLSAQAGDADWLRCAELRESAPRLACYDALAARLRQAPAALPSSGGRTSCPACGGSGRWGGCLRRAAARAGAGDRCRREPHPRAVEGWGPGQVFVLENGQRWFVADGSSAT
jgi:hypothetical protein